MPLNYVKKASRGGQSLKVAIPMFFCYISLMKEVCLNTQAAFTIPYASIHEKTSTIIRSDGVYKLKYGGWSEGSDHKAKQSKITYKRAYLRNCKIMVHRLVAETFIPNPDNKPTVDHIDRNPSNNDVSNLQWADYTEQALNTITHLNSPWCPEKKKAYNKRYYEKNKTRILAEQKQRYYENKGK